MTHGYIRAIGIAAAAFVTCAASTRSGGAYPFDGTWQVTLVCAATPQGAPAVNVVFPATVSGGHLHAQYGTPGQVPSFTYDGSVWPDGHARIDVNGITGQSPKGQPYSYPFVAQFEGGHGHGKRVEVRPCDMDFARQ
jgi:hypothetical protein